MNPFARALLDIAKEEGNTLSLEAIRNAAFEKLQSGDVKTLVSTSVNSKSFTYNVSMPANELFAAASWGIRQFNKGTITAIEWDFSRL